MLPPGGAEVHIGVLFADVRGSTSLAEGRSAGQFAELMNRFYATATDVLVRHDAIVDKLIGDEIMALFVPGFAGEEYMRHAGKAADALLRAVGYGSESGPWLDVGVGVYAGVAYVGNVGGAVMDFTALGDTVNVAARLQGQAASGEMLLAAEVQAVCEDLFPNGEPRTLNVKGREEAVASSPLSCSSLVASAPGIGIPERAGFYAITACTSAFNPLRAGPASSGSGRLPQPRRCHPRLRQTPHRSRSANSTASFASFFTR